MTGFTLRRSISLQPLPAGSKPTPISTKPVYSSACATTRCPAIRNSAPPPSAMPNGAVTTGFGA